MVGSFALVYMGGNMTRRYFVFPHFHKDEHKPLTLANGELHPYDKQPKVSKAFRLVLVDLTHVVFSLVSSRHARVY